MRKTNLRVRNSHGRTPRKSTEAQFERKIAGLLTDAGLYSYHVSDTTFGGLPDRYVCSGRWIEMKQAAVVYRVSPMRLVSPRQILQMDRFLEHGDQPFVCILFQFSHCEPLCVLMPWEEFRIKGRKKWTSVYIRDIGYEEEDWTKMLKENGFG